MDRVENLGDNNAQTDKIVGSLARQTGLPNEYFKKYPVNLELLPSEVWNKEWSLEDPGQLQKGDFAIVGSDITGFDKGPELIHVDDQIGNAFLITGGKIKKNTAIFRWEPRPGWSVKVNFQEKPIFPNKPDFVNTVDIKYPDTEIELTKSKIPMEELRGVQIEVNEPAYGLDPLGDPTAGHSYEVHRTTGVKLGTREDIHFVNDELMVKEDVLIQGKIPIIISDFHSKITVHLQLLGALDLIPNIRPTMDWLDAHHDRYTHNTMPKKLQEVEYPTTLKKAIVITRKSNIGWAAMHLNADVHDIVDGATRRTPMPNAKHSNLFNSASPLGRKNPHRPHILSFDLDLAVPYITSKAYSQDDRPTEPKCEEFFSLLRGKGLKPDGFDAALIYTSPFYSYDPEAAKLALNTFLDEFV